MSTAEIGPCDKGPCPQCGVLMVEGRYWHMRAEHGRWEHYASPGIEDLLWDVMEENFGPVRTGIEYTCSNCKGKVFIGHVSAWPLTCPHCKARGIFYSLSGQAATTGEDAQGGER